MIALLTLVSLFVVGDTEKKDVPQGDLAKVQGVWRVTSSESRGRQSAAGRFAGESRSTLVVDGENYLFNTHAGTVKVDLGQKTIDFTITEGPYKDQSLKGRCELDGDTLKLAVHTSPARANGERPADFKTGDGATFTFYTLKRDTQQTKEQSAAKLKELKANPGNVANFGGGAGFGVPASQTQEMLKQILDRLDKIDKRLDEMEKRLPEKK